MSPKKSAADTREQTLRKLQEHLEKLKEYGGKPPKEKRGNLQAEVERAREQFTRDFMEDFGSWERLYGYGETNSGAAPVRDRGGDCRLLGVSGDASQGEIKRAFHALAKKHHPDTGGDVAKFRELMAAYRFLSNG